MSGKECFCQLWTNTRLLKEKELEIRNPHGLTVEQGN